MSHPILYSATETKFDHNGLGILGDCASCEVTEEANGIFELAMAYPMDGIHYADIADRAIIKAKADQFRDPQLFRVYAISKPMSGIVTVLAEHISYDLSGIPVKPFAAESAVSALAGLRNNAVVDCPFEFWTDKSTIRKFSVLTPASIRSRLGGVAGSILDVYGGEYEFDNYTVKLRNNRGMNRGVSIRYGKNLTDIQQEQNCASVATGVYPYWAGDVDGNTVLVELPEKIVNAPGTYNFVKIRTLDLSSEFETQPTVDQLRSRTESYIKSNNIGVPKVSLTVSFVQLEQYEEYKHLKLLERVSLFDTVNVDFPALGVSATAKAVKMVYDVLSDRVKSVTLGSVRSNIADTIANQQNEIQNTPTKSDLKRAQEAATAWLTNGKGYKVERRDESGRVIDTLYMDTPDIETAVNVLRIGQSGIGFSHNGVSGPYESAWTIDGKFNADWIYTGTLYGLLFKAGLIESIDGKIKIDLSQESSEPVFNTGISTNGLKIRGDAAGSGDLFRLEAVRGAITGEYFADASFFSTNGTKLATITETFTKDYAENIGMAMYMYNQEHTKNVLIDTGDIAAFRVMDGLKTVGMLSVDSLGNGDLFLANSENTRSARIITEGSRAGLWLIGDGNYVGYFLVNSDGKSTLSTNIINGREVSWKDNGDGTFTLAGQ